MNRAPALSASLGRRAIANAEVVSPKLDQQERLA